MTESQPAICLCSLAKRYGGSFALRDVSLCVAPGTVFGLLGPNGAGKSTTLQAIMGLVRPTSGKVWIDGVPIDSPQIHARRREVGYVPDQTLLYEHLTAREFLTFIGSLRGLDEAFGERLEAGLLTLGLASDGDMLLRRYSLGMKRKVAFLAATLSRPKVLVLDEPTAALDVASARSVAQIIRDFRDRGAAVLLATHQLDFAERLSDIIGILDGGQLRFAGPPAALREAHGLHPNEALEEIFLRLTSVGETAMAPRVDSASQIG